MLRTSLNLEDNPNHPNLPEGHHDGCGQPGLACHDITLAWLAMISTWLGLPWNGLDSSPRLEIRLYLGLLKKVTNNDIRQPTTNEQTYEARAILASAWCWW